MAGLYLHIPFCKQKCHYCNFYSLASLRYKPRIVEAIGQEIGLAAPYLEGEPLKTIYLGGGTPSMLDQQDLNYLFDAIYRHFPVEAGAEITLEANPDDLDEEKISIIRSTPVNRLSVGVQSFHDDDLVALNRIHNGAQAVDAIRDLQQSGLTNLSIDLIYGIPGLTDAKWQQNLEIFADLKIPHLSAYSLTVEPHTTLDWLISHGRNQPLNEDQSVAQFQQLQRFATQRGYQQYEISNFSLPGMHSRHNAAYWSGDHYLGVGPAAHSFNGGSRRWNVANSKAYIDSIAAGQLNYEEELLTSQQQHNEYLLTSLRTMEGCDLRVIARRFGEQRVTALMDTLHHRLDPAHYHLNEHRVTLTNEGMLFADGFASSLFWTED